MFLTDTHYSRWDCFGGIETSSAELMMVVEQISRCSLSPSPHTLFCFFARLLLKMHNYYWWKVRLHFTHNASQKVPPIPSPLSRNLLVVVRVNGMWLLCDHCLLDLVCLTCNCSNVLVVAKGEVKNPQDNNRKISINFFKNHSSFFFFLLLLLFLL